MRATGSLAIVLVQFGGRAIPERYIIPTAIGIQAATVVRLATAAITRLTMDVTIRAVADLLAELAAAAPSVTVLVPILATNATTSQRHVADALATLQCSIPGGPAKFVTRPKTTNAATGLRLKTTAIHVADIPIRA